MADSFAKRNDLKGGGENMKGFTSRIQAPVAILVIIIAMLVSALANATTSRGSGSRETGYVKIDENRDLFVDFQKPVEGKPIVVLLNGLTYRTGSWDSFVYWLSGEGLGILRYDPMGMGKTLIKHGIPTEPIDYKNQVRDLRLLLDALKIRQPVHVVGLSYGGALALEFARQFPKRAATVTVIAPFVAPLANQDAWIKLQVQQARALNPYNPATYDELYDFFLRMNVYTTYPPAEPVVLEHPYKLEGVFRLVQGIRRFQAKEIVKQLPPGKLHLVIARQDQYVPNAVHDEFWEQLPETARASRLYIEGSEHKIPEAVPRFASAWIRRIAEGDKQIGGGKTYIGTPWRGGIVESGSARINVYEKR
jgi:pimeloyl-ACP methyl ester carboxylesterase